MYNFCIIIYMHLWLLIHRRMIFSNKRQIGRVNQKAGGWRWDGNGRSGERGKYKFDEKGIYFQKKKKVHRENESKTDLYY